MCMRMLLARLHVAWQAGIGSRTGDDVLVTRLRSLSRPREIITTPPRSLAESQSSRALRTSVAALQRDVDVRAQAVVEGLIDRCRAPTGTSAPPVRGLVKGTAEDIRQTKSEDTPTKRSAVSVGTPTKRMEAKIGGARLTPSKALSRSLECCELKENAHPNSEAHKSEMQKLKALSSQRNGLKEILSEEGAQRDSAAPKSETQKLKASSSQRNGMKEIFWNKGAQRDSAVPKSEAQKPKATSSRSNDLKEIFWGNASYI